MRSTARISTGAAVLWASAFLLAAMVIAQAGRLPGPAAYAENAATHGDYAAVTARSGLGPDDRPYESCFIIDSRDQILMVFEVEDAQRNQVLLRDGGSLENLFRNARPR